ncbi:MAG: tetratricopeptide repeat protein, partial [Myxococcota bacterium]
MERFNKALEHDNTLYPVYKNMAFLSIHLGRYEEAEQYFLKAKAFASDDKEAYHNLLLDIARYYLSRDEFEKSIKYYQEA